MAAAAQTMEPTRTDNFRMAMRNVASSVFLVTTHGPSGYAGMTATSVCSLSLDPPSVLICVNRSNVFIKALLASRRFALNILSREDESVARAFSSHTGRANRFVSGDWYEMDGLPALKSSLSTMVCEIVNQIDFGTHRIFIGQVSQIDNRDGRAELVYYQGGFRTLHRELKQSIR
jgi:flavin reductase